ncbi:aminotransferase class V-fold PLP-dependent enzyme [Candidatus Woesearchaeota archaeon]|nr:aminotransferase class V-fold PLP-dependent enzyme [Candidatus Woesearchaeota archaeon]
MNRTIYLDTSSSTPVDPLVYLEMHRYFQIEYGNAGSMHAKGLIAAHALNLSRSKVAKILNCHSDEIIFTGSGTESVNLAIKGVVNKLKNKGKHIISTTIEHHAVLDTLEFLEKQGFEVTYVPVEPNGIVNPEKIKNAIKKETILISVMYANNEIGTIQPIKEIAKIAKENNILFHTDACQAANSESLDVQDLNVDLLSINGSKIYGPKGVGCLYKKEGIRIEPLIHGGGQEFNLRSGTENIAAIVGFAKALEIAQKGKEDYKKKLTPLRDYFIENLLKIENTILNGDNEKRLPNNVNITFLNIEGEAVLLKLDSEGVCASSGSACTSKSLDPSHVILALGRPYEAAHGSIRFSLSKNTTKEEIDYVLQIIPKIVQELRNISPVNLKIEDIKNV